MRVRIMSSAKATNAETAVQAKTCSTFMGLEKRGNHYYYYRKERTGSRVVSVYEGKGSLAQLMYQFAEMRKEEERIEKEDARERLEAQKAEQEEIDDKIEAVCADTSALVDALFFTNGYHQHSRTWRRKRNG